MALYAPLRLRVHPSDADVACNPMQSDFMPDPRLQEAVRDRPPDPGLRGDRVLL